MRPLIGITPDLDLGAATSRQAGEPTYFLRARYIAAIEDLGGVPVILALSKDRRLRRQVLDGLDGLLLTGSGPDLPPKLYGERQRFEFKIMAPQRYEFELEMARLAAETNLPLLGICGGMQAINVALGGSLLQDIASQREHTLEHRVTPATRPAHPVQIATGTRLARIVRKPTIRVNTSHHQAVNQLAPSLVASAVAPDGIIEAFEAPAHRFLLGVQWHPEFLYRRDENQRRLFRAFLRAAATR